MKAFATLVLLSLTGITASRDPMVPSVEMQCISSLCKNDYSDYICIAQCYGYPSKLLKRTVKGTTCILDCINSLPGGLELGSCIQDCEKAEASESKSASQDGTKHNINTSATALPAELVSEIHPGNNRNQTQSAFPSSTTESSTKSTSQSPASTLRTPLGIFTTIIIVLGLSL
ncbi:hypothetical protein BB560_005212 [Smittium megazygosporum]|uniref:Extracellular membrane protein CFEM domain-containing protein n=1 Tax=Smittium megazygosporum TaxID=133381 RepID=A0A2T9Z738_9FUNG|nr:hypothetical protein BB560_005212 [Smittium megazygosporum]